MLRKLQILILALVVAGATGFSPRSRSELILSSNTPLVSLGYDICAFCQTWPDAQGTHHNFLDGDEEYRKCIEDQHFACHGETYSGWCSFLHTNCNIGFGLLDEMSKSLASGDVKKFAQLAADNADKVRLNTDRQALQFMDCSGELVAEHFALTPNEFRQVKRALGQ
jgi:hypothetical protein